MPVRPGPAPSQLANPRLAEPAGRGRVNRYDCHYDGGRLPLIAAHSFKRSYAGNHDPCRHVAVGELQIEEDG